MKSSHGHGYGVVAIKRIPMGTRLSKYTGRILKCPNLDPFDHGADPMRTVELEKGVYVSGTRGMHTLFQHSCNPNCWLGEYFVVNDNSEEIPKLSIFATRDIEAGEECSYHYGRNFRVIIKAGSKDGSDTCLCGTCDG